MSNERAPFPSVGPAAPVAGRWSSPGGWARCHRTASGSVGPHWCGANEGALLLRHVWSWHGARRARGEHDGQTLDGSQRPERVPWASGAHRTPQYVGCFAAQPTVSPVNPIPL